MRTAPSSPSRVLKESRYTREFPWRRVRSALRRQGGSPVRTRIFPFPILPMRTISWGPVARANLPKMDGPPGRRKRVPLASRTDLYDRPLLAQSGHPKYLGNVRYWVNSGKHMLAGSFSGFDPSRKSAPGNGAPDRVQCRSTQCQLSDSHRTGGPDSSRSKDRFETTYSISPRVKPISVSSQSFRRYNSARSLCRLPVPETHPNIS
jgi:hypothetical protein